MAGDAAEREESVRYSATAARRSRSSRHDRSSKHIRSPPDVEELRSKRTSYYERPPEERIKLAPESKRRSSYVEVRIRGGDDGTRESGSSELKRSSTRKRRDSAHDYVYAPDRGEAGERISKSRSPVKHSKEDGGQDTRRRSIILDTPTPRPLSIRTTSLRDQPSTLLRPLLRRSFTSYTRSRPKADKVPAEEIQEEDGESSRHRRRHVNTRSVSSPTVPVQTLVECLICASEVPIHKSAKLACSHRMCHSCLKRIFVMSTTDPAHMPPKCCTSEHIPLRHVDALFDDKFKLLWNKKYQEYKTSNRLYCPSKTCGEWIRLTSIHTDPRHPARKYAVCKRCKTKVCASCNNRYHKRPICPDDPETARFIASAKDNGWQSCYNCKAMVELKEGCNHMTCRCTAEFCMLCGSKWKTCDCAWFNHLPVLETDRLQHMRVPYVVEVPGLRRRATDPVRGRDPALTYQMEMDARREQERADEELARRLQQVDVGLAGMFRHVLAPTVGRDGGQRHAAAADNTFGVGNGNGHFLNDNFVRNASDLVMRAFDGASEEAGRRVVRPPERRRSVLYNIVPASATQPPATRESVVATERSGSTDAVNAAGLKTVPGKDKKAEKKKANFGRITKNGGAAQGAKAERIQGWLAKVEPEE